MERSIDQAAPNPSLIFISLACLELAWNASRSILICISVRYYFEIIKEVRQVNTIRLTDFTDIAAHELEQEFHDEMMNEYPGFGHKENVMWYTINVASCIATIFLDVFAALSVYSHSYFLLLSWICLYLTLSICETASTIFMMRKCTNKIYFKRKWRHCVFTFAGCIIFRLYLIWISLDLPFSSTK